MSEVMFFVSLGTLAVVIILSQLACVLHATGYEKAAFASVGIATTLLVFTLSHAIYQYIQ